MLSVTRYAVKTESLIPYVKHIWYFQQKYGEVHHKLLPTDDIDILINLADDIIYESDGKRFAAPPCHINGLRSKPGFIHHTGRICVFGISFHAHGLYPFIRRPLAIQDQIVSLSKLSQPLSEKLQAAVSLNTADQAAEDVESVLNSELLPESGYSIQVKLIKEFLYESAGMTVTAFCDEKGINIKTFERSVKRYTGYAPNILYRIRRFQQVSNQLVHRQSSLTDLTYDHQYADQAHMIREFRRFSGAAPREFQKQSISVKENIGYSYR